MATRLEKALHELTGAMQGRPFVLAFQLNHADAQTHTLSTVTPPHQPLYASRGLLMEAQDFLVQESGAQSKISTNRHSRWERNDRRTLDAISLVVNFGSVTGPGESSQNYMDEVLRYVGATWTDEECQEAEEWARWEHLGASDNKVKRMPRPRFLPPDWK
jgi:hypothetical protein